MPTIKEILAAAELIAPAELALERDNVGLLVDAGKDVESALVSLDITHDVIGEAINLGCGLIVSHHPVIYSPLKQINSKSVVYRLAQLGISALCMHTNWDSANGGVNDVLCELLAVQNPQKLGFGRIGRLENPMPATDFAAMCAKMLGTSVNLADGSLLVSTVAVVGGNGKSLLEEVFQSGADCLVTGEAGHHAALEALATGVTLVEAGHYATEKPSMAVLAKKLRVACPSLNVYESKTERTPFHWVNLA